MTTSFDFKFYRFRDRQPEHDQKCVLIKTAGPFGFLSFDPVVVTACKIWEHEDQMDTAVWNPDDEPVEGWSLITQWEPSGSSSLAHTAMPNDLWAPADEVFGVLERWDQEC